MVKFNFRSHPVKGGKHSRQLSGQMLHKRWIVYIVPQMIYGSIRILRLSGNLTHAHENDVYQALFPPIKGSLHAGGIQG